MPTRSLANPTIPDPQLLARLIEAGDTAGIGTVLDALPPTKFTADARPLAVGSDLALRLMGVNMIGEELARAVDPSCGAALAHAALAAGRAHLDDVAARPAQIAESVAYAAGNLALALDHAGHHAEIVALADTMDTLLAGRTDGNRLVGLRLAAIEAQIALNRLEDAERALVALEATGCTHPSLPFVRDRLAARLRSVTIIADTRSPARRARDDRRVGNIAAARAIEGLMRPDAANAALLPGLGALVEQAKTEKLPADLWASFDAAQSGMRRVGPLLGLQDTAPFGWKMKVHDASTAFRDNGGRDPALLA